MCLSKAEFICYPIQLHVFGLGVVTRGCILRQVVWKCRCRVVHFSVGWFSDYSRTIWIFLCHTRYRPILCINWIIIIYISEKSSFIFVVWRYNLRSVYVEPCNLHLKTYFALLHFTTKVTLHCYQIMTVQTAFSIAGQGLCWSQEKHTGLNI